MKDRIKIKVDNYLKDKRGINKSDIEKIIYITDTDGCYIAQDSIHLSLSDDSYRYENDGIYTKNISNCKERNSMKSKNLNIINSVDKVYSIKIETYYFSCNLDHVLYKNQNLSHWLKVEYGERFADKFEDKEINFIDFIGDNNIVLSCEYKESWDKIKIELNSVLRYSNLIVFFIRNLDYLKVEVAEYIKKMN